MLAREQHVSFRIDDKAGNDAEPSAKRTAKEADLPWNLIVTSSEGPVQLRNLVLRGRLFIAGFLLLAGMVLTANYLIIRAVKHERAVARLQTDFVATVSHEFRTPLTALRQFTDMLREHEGQAPEQGKDRRMVCYDAQSRATNRLTRLVESLLDFGRMEAGIRRYTFERRDCTEFVRQVVQDFRDPAGAAGFRVEFSGNGSASIEADGESLFRAIWNLLDNAVKYSPGRDSIAVGLHRHGGNVRIAIRDYGIGVPAHEHSAIFSKFQRGEQVRIRGIKGTGIGLTMVDEIVRAHHGRIEVKSEPGKGSTFTIILPVKD
jgi:two-component system phosphate regulon sensor histidine kinase PhoR